MIISRSIHVAAYGLFHSFLWLSNIPLYMCTMDYSIYICTMKYYSAIEKNCVCVYTHTHTHGILDKNCIYRYIRPWCWERLKAGGEGDNKGWNGWMASLTQWTWVWASSGSWWWTGKPGALQSMGSQRVRLDWATKLNSYIKGRSKGSNFPLLRNKPNGASYVQIPSSLYPLTYLKYL